MTATPPDLPAGFTAKPGDRGAWLIHRDGVYVGTVFPQVVPRPEGRWFVRPAGEDAWLGANQQAAINYLASHVLKEIQ